MGPEGSEDRRKTEVVKGPKGPKVSTMFFFTKRVHQNDEEILGPVVCMSSRCILYFDGNN